eukprot:9019549-Pyramimonas_sp.AAC.2
MARLALRPIENALLARACCERVVRTKESSWGTVVDLRRILWTAGTCNLTSLVGLGYPWAAI